MTILIKPAPELEEAITRAAERAGVTREEFILSAAAEKAREEGFTPKSQEDSQLSFPPGATWNGISIADFPILGMFAQWEADDPVTSPVDRAERTRAGDAITAAIEANRLNIPRDPELVAIIEGRDEKDGRHQQETIT